MKNPNDFVKMIEIKHHVKTLFHHYDEDKSFLEEYLESVFQHDLDRALNCFRELIKYLPKRQENAEKTKIEQTEQEQNKIYANERFGAYSVLGKLEKTI
jgi:hypothetical protein